MNRDKRRENDELSEDREARVASRALLLRTLLPLFIAWLCEMFSRSAFTFGYIDGTQRDLLGMTAFVLLAFSSIMMIRMLHGVQWLRWMILASIFLLMMAQISDVIDEFEFAQSFALLARRHPAHLLLEYCIFITGAVLLTATCYGALMDGEMRRRELRERRAHLERSIAERRRAELELKEARNRLEMEVEARTSELADRNMRLAVELAERHRFEEKLEEKLRYEEGLAACSRILVSGGDHPHVFEEALRHLALASRTDRVYFYLCDVHAGEARQFELSAFFGVDQCRTAFSFLPAETWQSLERGDVTSVALTDACPEDIAVAMKAAGAKSALLIPIFWEGAWRGIAGFEDLMEPRDWDVHEVRILKTAGEIMGACKQRQRAELALRTAYDDLEHRVEDRTQDLTLANALLNKEIQDRNRLERDKAQLQTKLRQAQKMQAIGTLAGGIAHDFNNILASILGYTELAIDRLPAGDPQRRYHDEVLKAANRAKDLTHQILLFSRQADQQKSAVFPHLIAQEVLALLDVTCPSNIQIERKIDSSSGSVLSDTVHMHQVFLNLCTNAQHAMKSNGGVLTVTVAPLQADQKISTIDGELPPGEYLYVAVRDTGEGISPGAVERIFDPFFTTKSVEEGTGMGLAIVHGIVTGQGGGIRCESTLGAGTLFEVFLPVYNGPVEETIKPVAQHLAGSERVLVVDDEPQLVELWKEMLERFGYSVTGFDSSLKGLEHFRNAPSEFDIALLDQTMPGLTGADLARKILAERPDIPVIIATGFSEVVSPELAREIGLAELIYKPILGNDLAVAIRRALDARCHSPIEA